MFVIGAHYGVMGIAGTFYPSGYCSNGAGWAASVGKIGSIVGSVLGGVALKQAPVRTVFAMVGVYPMLLIGRARNEHRPRADWGQTGALQASEVPASE
jgi:AAHS family 4-hydroxybenzoate transporter-like MFS transporter